MFFKISYNISHVDVARLFIKLKPLNSAYTQSANSNEPGAPEKSAEEKSPKTLQNEESLDNQGGSE